MSDLAERIKDLRERIAIARTEFEDRQIGGTRPDRREVFQDPHANIFFDEDRRLGDRYEELQRELAAAEAELAQQVATSPAAPDVSLDYPLISVPDGGLDAANTTLTIDDVANFETLPTAPDSAPASDRPRSQEKPGTGRPMTQEKPGTGVKDPVPETRSPVLFIAAAGLVAAVLAIGVWQAVAGSPQTASVATTAPVPTTTSRPATTAAPVAAAPTATAVTIRVTGQPAVYSGPCSGYSVTFAWIVEGTQSGNFMMRTGEGDTYGPESGPFTLSGSGGNLTWEPTTGRLTIRGASDSGASLGFRAQITKVNGREPAGDATSIAAPGYCS